MWAVQMQGSLSLSTRFTRKCADFHLILLILLEGRESDYIVLQPWKRRDRILILGFPCGQNKDSSLCLLDPSLFSFHGNTWLSLLLQWLSLMESILCATTAWGMEHRVSPSSWHFGRSLCPGTHGPCALELPCWGVVTRRDLRDLVGW